MGDNILFVAGGNSSVGRAMAFQAVGRGFESRFPLHFLALGAVAQRESTSLARKGSGVQIASAPPVISRVFGIFREPFFVIYYLYP